MRNKVIALILLMIALSLLTLGILNEQLASIADYYTQMASA